MSRCWLLFLLGFLSGGFCIPAAGQEHSYADYTVKDGLAGSTVYSMARDRDGFLWFGTETGLSRFDGTHFRNFYMSDGLPDNEIIKVFVDSRNRVWIVPFKNSICYYLNGMIHNQQNDPLLGRLKIGSEVISVNEDVHGDLIIAESKAIDVVHPGGKITIIDRFEGWPFMVVQAGLDEKGECKFFISSHSPGAQVAVIRHDVLVRTGDLEGEGENNYTSTYLGPELLIYEDKDSLTFLQAKEPGRVRIPSPKGFLHISRIDDSSVTLNSYSSTYLYNVRQHRIVDSFLPGQMVNGALEDAEGGLWFSTLGSGVHRLANRDVERYTFREGNTVFPVFTIQRIGNTLYAGTDRFYLWSRQEGEKTFRSMKVDDKFSRGRITAIEDLGNNSILAGTDAGVFRFDAPRGQSRRLWHRGAVKAIRKTGDSMLIEFSGSNVRRLRLPGGTLLDTVFPGRSTCGWVRGDRCFVGTLNGLYAVSLSRRTQPEELLEGRISAITAAPDSGIWVATYGEGLVLLRKGRPVSRFTVADGLTSNICRCLYAVGGSVWVGTDKGLNRVAPRDGGYIITPFTGAEGLGVDVINTVYVDGQRVYAGTPDGMLVFQEDRIVRSKDCRLRLTGIHISGGSWPLDTANFILPYRNNDLQIEYVGISYRNSGPIDYRYRLLGIDDRWATTDQTFLHYPSLPPGRYELQVLAIDPSGAISGTLRLPFAIDKPWWELTWVRIGLVLLIAGLVWLTFSYRVRTIRRKEAEKTATAARMAELEQMALRSRMNPHFIFNSLNSIQLFVMEKDIRGANEYITHFSRLIRQTLDISARSQLTLQEEIDYLSTYLELEKRRFEEAFDYDIFVAADVDKRMQMLPTMILQPYVENAILHGIAHRQDKQGKIMVLFRSDGHFLICMIEDNGVGRERAAQYKRQVPGQYPSRGMELTARRIDILNSTMKEPISAEIEDITAVGGLGEGTRVIVRFPL